MKKLICALIFFGLTLSAPRAIADERGGERFVRGRLWHLAELPAWWFVWTVIHESSHALTGTALGYENCGIHPYPHEHDGVYSYGDAFCDGQPNNDIGAIFYLMPSLVDITVFTTSDLILTRHVIDPDSLAGGLLFMGGMLAPWIDFTLNANGLDAEYTDNALFAKSIGVPRWSVMLVQDAIAAAGLIRLISVFQEVFFEKRETDSGLAISILPASNNLGLQVAGQF